MWRKRLRNERITVVFCLVFTFIQCQKNFKYCNQTNQSCDRLSYKFFFSCFVNYIQRLDAHAILSFINTCVYRLPLKNEFEDCQNIFELKLKFWTNSFIFCSMEWLALGATRINCMVKSKQCLKNMPWSYFWVSEVLR